MRWSASRAGTAHWRVRAALRTASIRAGRKRVATPEHVLFDQQPGGRFATRREAKLAVFDYLETFYTPPPTPLRPRPELPRRLRSLEPASTATQAAGLRNKGGHASEPNPGPK